MLPPCRPTKDSYNRYAILLGPGHFTGARSLESVTCLNESCWCLNFLPGRLITCPYIWVHALKGHPPLLFTYCSDEPVRLVDMVIHCYMSRLGALIFCNRMEVTRCNALLILQAHDYASKAMHLQPDSQQALLALIYVELCKGNCSKALYLLKQQHLPVQ